MKSFYRLFFFFIVLIVNHLQINSSEDHFSIKTNNNTISVNQTNLSSTEEDQHKENHFLFSITEEENVEKTQNNQNDFLNAIDFTDLLAIVNFYNNINKSNNKNFTYLYKEYNSIKFYDFYCDWQIDFI